MISETSLRLLVGREKAQWYRMDKSEFVRGVLHGLEMLKQFARQLHETESARRQVIEGTYNQATARTFWRTINTAAHLLETGNRQLALARLRKTIAQYRARQIAKAENI